MWRFFILIFVGCVQQSPHSGGVSISPHDLNLGEGIVTTHRLEHLVAITNTSSTTPIDVTVAGECTCTRITPSVIHLMPKESKSVAFQINLVNRGSSSTHDFQIDFLTKANNQVQRWCLRGRKRDPFVDMSSPIVFDLPANGAAGPPGTFRKEVCRGLSNIRASLESTLGTIHTVQNGQILEMSLNEHDAIQSGETLTEIQFVAEAYNQHQVRWSLPCLLRKASKYTTGLEQINFGFLRPGQVRTQTITMRSDLIPRNVTAAFSAGDHGLAVDVLSSKGQLNNTGINLAVTVSPIAGFHSSLLTILCEHVPGHPSESTSIPVMYFCAEK